MEAELNDLIGTVLQLPRRDWTQYPPLSLAWIGDTVYDLIVRNMLLRRGMTKPENLHKKSIFHCKCACAGGASWPDPGKTDRRGAGRMPEGA